MYSILNNTTFLWSTAMAMVALDHIYVCMYAFLFFRQENGPLHLWPALAMRKRSNSQDCACHTRQWATYPPDDWLISQINNFSSSCNLVEFSGPQTEASFKLLLASYHTHTSKLRLASPTHCHCKTHYEMLSFPKKQHLITTITNINTLTLSSAFYQQ